MSQPEPQPALPTPPAIEHTAGNLHSLLVPLAEGGTPWEPLPPRNPAPTSVWQGPGLRGKLLDL